MFKNKAEEEYQEHKLHLKHKYEKYVHEYSMAIFVLKNYQAENPNTELNSVILKLSEDRDFYEDILKHTW